MALIDKLSAIGDAIRAKTGKTDKMTLDQMPNEIASIQTGGGGGGNIAVTSVVISDEYEHQWTRVYATTYDNEFNYAIRTPNDGPSMHIPNAVSKSCLIVVKSFGDSNVNEDAIPISGATIISVNNQTFEIDGMSIDIYQVN
jgi:hypothetical protein